MVGEVAVANSHASGVTSGEPVVPEPSFAERARTLVHLGRVGNLSTLSKKRPGWPFGSVMPYAVDERGRPILLISNMAMHTQNILGDSRASLLVTAPESNEDPLGAGRVTLLGNAAGIPQQERDRARSAYLERHEKARYWVDFEDFSFFSLHVIDVYLVGGFGVMGWVAAEEYERAAPDPLAEAGSGIIEHMNADHAGALVLLAKRYTGLAANEARMTSVDRLGFHVRLDTADRVQGRRIPFLREVRTAGDARKVLIEMVNAARRAGP